jgi:hypothetical protein
MAPESRDVASSSEPSLPPAVAKTPVMRPAPAKRATLVDAKLNLMGEDRQRLIAEAAYFRAERRGFQPGAELEDWLAAEIEIEALLGDDDGRA